MSGFSGFPGFGGFGGMGGTTQFDITISIEALVLPGADRTDQLNSAISHRLAFKDLDDYRRPITRRNIFAPYTEREEDADASRDAYITAVMKVDGRLQAWLSFRNLGTVRKLRQGDRIDVGSVHATVAQILDQAIEIESDGKRRKVKLGSSLSESQDLPPGNDSGPETSESATPAEETSPAPSTTGTPSAATSSSATSPAKEEAREGDAG